MYPIGLGMDGSGLRENLEERLISADMKFLKDLAKAGKTFAPTRFFTVISKCG